MTARPEVHFPLAGRRIWVAGHRGMVGSAVVRRLAAEDCELLTVDHADLDLTELRPVEDWLAQARPDAIVLAAARVGGILANDSNPASFLYDNLAIQNAVIESARRIGVPRLLFLGSSCIYPRLAPQPIPEEALLTGPLEPTNQWYAIAKIAGLKMCQAYRRQYGCDFVSVMPTNLYGPGDKCDLRNSHVIPALMAKAHAAKLAGAERLPVWGTGRPRREFLHVDDAADAIVFLLERYDGEAHINVGAGTDLPIAELAGLIARVVGFEGALSFETDKPDGTPQKLLDVSRLTALGWKARIGFEDGLRQTYDWYVHEIASA